MPTPHPRPWISFAAALLLTPALARSVEIDGVQPAAIDQPRINLIVRRDAKAKPLEGESLLAGKTAKIEAFLDTGASGIMISSHTADLLGIKHETAAGHDAGFEDVGVGGSDHFAISEPLFFFLAPFQPGSDATDDPIKDDSAFNQSVGPLRAQVGPLSGGITDALMSMAIGDLDVVGMPAMQKKVIVMNTGIVNSFMDTIRTYIYDPNTKDHPDLRNSDPGIMKTRYHIKLNFASFATFTTTTSPGAQPPIMAGNPFIGSSPLQPDATPGVVVSEGGKQSKGSWLLDTGAAASMISRKQAEAIGIKYTLGTEDSDHPKLDGIPANQQFVMTIGGVGGTKKSAGFYIDSLTLTTREGDPIIFKHAPVLVADITIEDPTTKKQLTLDGVFGMNFLVATAKIDEAALMPDIDHLTAGGFKWVVFDQPNATLGLEPTDDVARQK